MKFFEKNKNVFITIIIMTLVLVAYIASDKQATVKRDGYFLSCADIKASSLSNYKEALCGSKKIIYISRTGCSYCEKIEPIKNEVKEKYNLDFIEINTADLDTDAFNELVATNDFLKTEDWGTPLFMIVENGEIVDSSIGYKEKAALVDFFKENGFINE